MKFKMNIPVRLRNPYFWVGLVGVILAAMGYEVNDFSTWQSVYDAFMEFLHTPRMIVAVCMAVLGVFVDPTTHGISDSNQAMLYTRPKK